MAKARAPLNVGAAIAGNAARLLLAGSGQVPSEPGESIEMEDGTDMLMENGDPIEME